LATQRINEDMQIPNASKYYMLIEEIDDQLAQQHDINTAIRLALELVLRYKFYQEEELIQEG